jgi:CheY-like chemotaxis protein
MAEYRILIVDDQHDVRRMLASGLRTLEASIEVIEVPSGEEALLEASRLPVHLLVADVRLPGISGLELLVRIRKRNPSLKVILVTGLSEPNVRRQVADAGADAFFYKPVEMADFLDAVERCLGLVQTYFPMPPVAEPETPAAPPLSLAERLTNLQQELSASAILMLDENGQVIVRAGDLPDADLESSLILSVEDILHASIKVTSLLGMKVPESLSCFSGLVYNFYVAHVGHSHALLVTIPAATQIELGVIGRVLASAVKELQNSLAVSEEKPLFEEDKAFEAVQAVDEIDISAESVPEIDAIFSQATQQPLETQDLDAFWDSTIEQGGVNGVLDANTLTFEQARKLGLAPGEEKK